MKMRATNQTFHSELVTLINRYSLENLSDTPDFILAQYLESCLRAFEYATIDREQWHAGAIPNYSNLRPKDPTGDKASNV